MSGAKVPPGFERTVSPGPWRAVGDVDSPPHVVDAKGRLIADCAICGIEAPTREVCAANARLAAAAPELLRAARRALATLRAEGHRSEPGNVLQALSAAIFKAEDGAP